MNQIRCDPVVIVILVMITIIAFLPWKKWAHQILDVWANSNGYHIEELEDGTFFDHYLTFNIYIIYRVNLIDDSGHRTRCQAVIGPMIFGPWSWIKINWTK